MTNKYFARKVEYDGYKFDSIKERDRYIQLKYLQKQGLIMRLTPHPRFEILPAIRKKVTVQLKTKTKEVERTEEKAKYYTADFIYDTLGHVVIEDVKSKATKGARDYPLRRHLMKLLIERMNEGREGYWIFKET